MAASGLRKMATISEYGSSITEGLRDCVSALNPTVGVFSEVRASHKACRVEESPLGGYKLRVPSRTIPVCAAGSLLPVRQREKHFRVYHNWPKHDH